MSSIIFGPFRLLGNAHLFNSLFRWPVGVDMRCWSCRPEVRIRRRVHEKIRQTSNLLKTFEVRTLSNSNANSVTSLLNCHGSAMMMFNKLCRKRWSSRAHKTETVMMMGQQWSVAASSIKLDQKQQSSSFWNKLLQSCHALQIRGYLNV